MDKKNNFGCSDKIAGNIGSNECYPDMPNMLTFYDALITQFNNLCFQNGLNPDLHEPTISFEHGEHTTKIIIGVRPRNPIQAQ